MTFAQQNPQDTALAGASVFQQSAAVRAIADEEQPCYFFDQGDKDREALR